MRCYAARLNNINGDLDVFIGSKPTNNYVRHISIKLYFITWPMTGLNIFFSGFDFKAVPFEKAITMFEHVKIAESIYKGVVE